MQANQIGVEMAFRRHVLVLAVALTSAVGQYSTPANAFEGPLFATGLVLDGGPVPFAHVYLTWTDSSQMAVGSSTYPELLGAVQADSSGRYSLHLSPSQRMLSAIAPNGNWANLEITARTGQGLAVTTTPSRYWNGQLWASFSDRPEQSAASDANSVVVRSPQGVPTNTFPMNDLGIGSDAVTPQLIPCRVFTDSITNDSTRIIDFHDAPAVDGSYTYGKTADSDIERGIQGNGTGSWSVSGTTHISTSAGTSISQKFRVRTDAYIRTNFEYAHTHNGPTGDYCPDGFNTRKIYATTWTVGSSVEGGFPIRNCDGRGRLSPFAAGTTVNLDYSRAGKISYAIDAGPVNLGNTSGFSSYLKLTWVGKRGPFTLCNSNSSNYFNQGSGVVFISNHN